MSRFYVAQWIAPEIFIKWKDPRKEPAGVLRAP